MSTTIDGPDEDVGPPDWLAEPLARLDARLAAAAAAARAAYGPDAADDDYRGMYVDEDEVARLLSRAPGVPLLGPARGEPSLSGAGDSPLAWLRRTLDLEALDVDIVLVSLAPELDLRYERLYAFLQDDITKRRPSVDLALNLLCPDARSKLAARARFAPDAPLLRGGAIELMSDPARPAPALLSRAIKPDDQLVRLLLGDAGLDPRLQGCARLVSHPSVSLEDLTLSPLSRRSMTTLAQQARAELKPLRLSFEGRPGAGRTRAAEALARTLGVPLLVVDAGRIDMNSGDSGCDGAARVVREARLHEAVLLLNGLDALREHDDELEALLRELDLHPGIVIFAGTEPFEPTRTATRRRPPALLRFAFPTPDAATRRSHWRKQTQQAGIRASEPTLDALAARFRLSPGQIADAVATAADLRAQSAARDGEVELSPRDALLTAARAQAAGALGSLATKVTVRRTLADIVLPDDRLAQLREVCDTVRWRAKVLDDWGFGERLSLGKGLSVLFSGPSGTGKTLAAEIVAGELELELYRIDLSAIVSKYIGETEKNLASVFHEAQTASAIVFFDEADALFGKRSQVGSAHDRYANIEVSYLLQRIEEYDGAVILATNLAGNMDQAFVRRMQFTIDFALPDRDDRARIWKSIWPARTPLSDELDLDDLAERFELSGGHIRNVALAAAFLAAEDGAIGPAHVAHALRREYQKLGQVMVDDVIRREITR